MPAFRPAAAAAAARCQTNTAGSKIKLLWSSGATAATAGRRRGERPGQKIETVLLRQVVSGERRSVYRHGRLRRADASGRPLHLFAADRAGGPGAGGGAVKDVSRASTCNAFISATGKRRITQNIRHRPSHPPSTNICICRGPHLIRTRTSQI